MRNQRFSRVLSPGIIFGASMLIFTVAPPSIAPVHAGDAQIMPVSPRPSTRPSPGMGRPQPMRPRPNFKPALQRPRPVNRPSRPRPVFKPAPPRPRPNYKPLPPRPRPVFKAPPPRPAPTLRPGNGNYQPPPGQNFPLERPQQNPVIIEPIRPTPINPRPPHWRPPHYRPPFFQSPHWLWGEPHWYPGVGWYYLDRLRRTTLVFVLRLPRGCGKHRISRDSQTLYSCDGVFYRPVVHRGERLYEIITDIQVGGGIRGPEKSASVIRESSQSGLQESDPLRLSRPYMKGQRVVDLQRKLRSRGYNIGVLDGVFGRQTEAAVKRFQRDIGVKVDGQVRGRTAILLMQQ